MAKKLVQAMATVHGLRYGEQAELEVTPQVERLISRGLLALVVDAGTTAPADEAQEEVGDGTGGADADADPASSPAEDKATPAKRATKKAAAPKATTEDD